MTTSEIRCRSQQIVAALSRLARGAACYVVAMCCWGFGLYGHGVYLAELHRLHGWPASSISGATTAFYLLTAALVVFVSDAIARLGPRRVMLIGACCFCVAVALLAFDQRARGSSTRVYLLMAVGAATMHVGAISQRGGSVVRSPARARDQPRPQRRELRRHPGDAGAGAGDRAVWLCRPRCWAAALVAAVLLPAIAALDQPAAVARRHGAGGGRRDRKMDASQRVAELAVLERGGAVRAWR